MTAGAAEVRLVVRLQDPRGGLIETVGGEAASWEQVMVRNKDEYRDILGDGSARVSVSLGEKVGGPYGYSNVMINVTTTLGCNQDEETVARAHALAFQQNVQVLDDHFQTAYQLLEAHLSRHYREER